MTLRTRLFVSFVLVVAVPLLVGLVLLASALPRSSAARQERAVTAEARLAADIVASRCAQARAVAEAAGRAVLAVPADAVAEQEAALRSLVDRGLADALRVTAPDGGTTAVGDLPDDVGDCAAGELRAGPLVGVARLQQAGVGGAGAAVAAVGTGKELVDAVLAAVDGSGAALLSGAQVVATAGEVPSQLAADLVAGSGPARRRDDRVGAVAPVGAGGAAVLVVEPVIGGVDVVRPGLGIVLGAVLLAAAVAPLLARAATRPLEELGDAAARVASGDLDTTIDVRSRDEVGRLAASFNAMTDDLRDHIGQLEASRDELRAGLARLGETLTSTHDLDRMLSVVLETALATTGGRGGAVLLLDAAREHLELAVGRGLEDRVGGSRLRVRVGEGVVGAVVATGQPLHGELAALRPVPGEPTASTVVAVPLRGAGPAHGVLALYDVRGGAEDDLEPLRTLAAQAAIAVENVLRHRDVARQAVTDGLTGLANYRSFTETMAREMDRATRFGRPVGLLLLDIDHFKAVNDTFGHQRGDEVLVELARRVQAQVRDVDTVARYGGEELVVVLPETDQAGAELAAERIRRAVRDGPFGPADGEPVEVTVSLGVAVHPAHGTTAAALLRHADEALYAAKRAGRDTWRAASARPPGAPH